MFINVMRLHEDAIIPEYKSAGAAGFDLHALHGFVLGPHESIAIRTGLAFEIPEGFEMSIRGRSGIAFNDNVWGFNGTIDSDYRGEVKVLLHNMSGMYKEYKLGDRIAQAVVSPVAVLPINEAYELSETDRGTSGFGSTGK
jgi:dUTP pyrophosphatase